VNEAELAEVVEVVLSAAHALDQFLVIVDVERDFQVGMVAHESGYEARDRALAAPARRKRETPGIDAAKPGERLVEARKRAEHFLARRLHATSGLGGMHALADLLEERDAECIG
jgi:hypothetical protein